MAAPRGTGDAAARGLVLESEFAVVRLSVDRAGNGPRLRIEDLRSGTELYVDPFMLSCLVAADWSDLVRLADPGATSWGASQDTRRLRSIGSAEQGEQ